VHFVGLDCLMVMKCCIQNFDIM